MFDRAAVHTISIHVFNVAFLFCVYIYACVYSILHQFEPLYNLAHGNHPKKNKHILHNQKIAMAAWISNKKTTHPSKGSRGCEEEGATFVHRVFIHVIAVVGLCEVGERQLSNEN